MWIADNTLKKKYNIKDFLEYTNISGYKNNHIHLVEYQKQKLMRRVSAPIELGFYFLAIKLNFDKTRNFGQTMLDQADAFVYLDQPGDFLQWDIEHQISGYHILIDAGLFRKIAKEYSFTYYNNHEALFITKEEEKTITDLFQKALKEFDRNENFSKDIVISYASLILLYIQKFYSRQFDTREELYNTTVADFYKNLEAYYDDEKNALKMPSVSYFSDMANLSSNYFGDLIKHYTGRSPQEHIHQLIVQIAKNRLRTTSLSISEIAFSLGFEYPSYFATFFKKETGISPSVFRNQ
ncbi:AraC family transcriptional regulator [Chitinophaga lutea]|uniref:AraC family transcriptional regulator n=1 Tax=Chitinophaga lutea TaxID=2488634 RepID=A0A3N4PNF8_9BACT|nr:helix-turn-helix domain-containing protein [Chitinophaga lutea]RPE08179.1 AraC family transcriptional regulator [Chitinophaga lutea]